MFLKRYADEKGFEVPWLRGLGIKECNEGVMFPYYDLRGALHYYVTRNMTGRGARFIMPKGHQRMPFGLGWLPQRERAAAGKPLDALWVCEGETDALTLLWLDAYNVVGLPANPGRHALSLLPPALRVYVIPDNDEGGVSLVEAIRSVHNDVRVVNVPWPYKDLNDWYVKCGADEVQRRLEGANFSSTFFVPPRRARYKPQPVSAPRGLAQRELIDMVVTRLEELGGTRAVLCRGGKEVKVRCPFHDDRSPSLYINLETGLWYCFGCRSGGSVARLWTMLGGA